MLPTFPILVENATRLLAFEFGGVRKGSFINPVTFVLHLISLLVSGIFPACTKLKIGLNQPKDSEKSLFYMFRSIYLTRITSFYEIYHFSTFNFWLNSICATQPVPQGIQICCFFAYFLVKIHPCGYFLNNLVLTLILADKKHLHLCCITSQLRSVLASHSED